MSVIAEQINQDLIGAMKAKDEVRVSTLRLLNAAFKNKQIELGHELTDNEAVEVIAKGAKQRRESIDAYQKGGREDLAENEKKELEILSAYLPDQLTNDEIAKVVDEVIVEVGRDADFGRVIGQVMAKVKGRADGGAVSAVVRQKLGNG